MELFPAGTDLGTKMEPARLSSVMVDTAERGDVEIGLPNE
jgi:hypothetical protein